MVESRVEGSGDGFVESEAWCCVGGAPVDGGLMFEGVRMEEMGSWQRCQRETYFVRRDFWWSVSSASGSGSVSAML